MSQFKDTPLGKGIRTAYQTLAALIPIAVIITSTPELRDAVNGTTSFTAAILPVVIGLVTYAQNKYEDRK